MRPGYVMYKVSLRATTSCLEFEYATPTVSNLTFFSKPPRLRLHLKYVYISCWIFVAPHVLHTIYSFADV